MLQLNYRDSRPIYEQVKDGLRKLVISGAIAPDEKLPSVRSLASSLAINPNTIQRAYEALEREGYVYTVAGRGTFAAPQSDVGAERRGKLLADFAEAARELLYLGVSPNQLKAHLDTIAKEEER